MANFSKLNKVVSFQIRKIIPDGFGGFADLWREYFQTWAHVSQINNINPQVRSENFSNNFYRFVIRAHKGLPHYMRIKHGGKFYYVESIKEITSSSGYMEIIAYEKVKNDVPTKN